MSTNYTTLSLADVQTELAAMARDAHAAFGALDGLQLNWRPDAARWSVAQCIDHVLSANRQMFERMEAALDPARPRAVWQRLPGLPRLFGPMLIRSQAPEATRKFTASPMAQPAASEIDAGIVEQFVASQHEAIARVRALDERDAARVVMVSPFVAFITYSVLDGLRLVVAHQRRHYEQARRVTMARGFPASETRGGV